MKLWLQCFGRLLHADMPQERVISCVLVGLAIAYVGLSWTMPSPACADEDSGGGMAATLQPLRCY